VQTLSKTLHAKRGISCWMTDGYDYYQSTLPERINGILNIEFSCNALKT